MCLCVLESSFIFYRLSLCGEKQTSWALSERKTMIQLGRKVPTPLSTGQCSFYMQTHTCVCKLCNYGCYREMKVYVSCNFLLSACLGECWSIQYCPSILTFVCKVQSILQCVCLYVLTFLHESVEVWWCWLKRPKWTTLPVSDHINWANQGVSCVGSLSFVPISYTKNVMGIFKYGNCKLLNCLSAVSYAHQGCIYLIKNTVKTVIYYCDTKLNFQHRYSSLHCHMILQKSF